MTVLCNTQDGHFDIDLKEVSSLKGQVVELSEPNKNYICFVWGFALVIKIR